MKAEVKTPVLVAVVVAGILVLSYFLLKSMGSAGNLDQGQVQYTPGKPPWEETDASKKGPGTSPGASSGAAPSGVPSAAPATTPTGAAPAPPGMSAPEISSK